MRSARLAALTTVAGLAVAANPAQATCTCYTLSSAYNSGNCGVEAVAGTNPTTAQWNQIFQSVALGPATWGSAGPSVPAITIGCNQPQTPASGPAVFPCELLRAIAMAESTWDQFCVPSAPPDESGGASRTLIAQDCGYGAFQITSDMHIGEAAPWDRTQVAADPFYNAATGGLILAQKWQGTNCVGDNQPRVIEDWYTATWAYNSLSFLNNPNNPSFSSIRPVYDPTVGGAYPYQEKVWGWMEHPPSGAYWTALQPAYPNPSGIGTGSAPPALPEPSCAGPTNCAQTRPTHVSACLGSGGGTVSLTFSASPSTISAGGSSTLSWSATNATTCTASGGFGGTEPTSGSLSVSPSGTTTYTLTCSGPGGSSTQSATVTVNSSSGGPPAVYLSAYPQTIAPGASAGLGWASSNTASCSASGGWSGSQPPNGSTSVTPSATTTYTLTCTGTAGGSASASATVTVTAATPAVNLAVNPPAISPGASSTLEWSTAGMSSCTASGGWSGSQALAGSQQVSPGATTTYTLTCSGGGQSEQLVQNGAFAGTVTQWALSGDFFANSNFSNCHSCPGYAYLSAPDGNIADSNNLFGTMSQDMTLPAAATSIALSFWVSISTQETTTTTPFDVLSVFLENTQGTILQTLATFSNLDAGGYRQINVDLSAYHGQTVRLAFLGTTNASLGTVFRVDDVSVLATVPGQQLAASATLTVNSPSPPGLAFNATPTVIAPGQTSTLDWISGNTTSCTASNGWSGSQPTGGNQLVSPAVTTTYTLTCSGAGGSVTASVTVTVQTAAPTVSLTASPASILAGASSTLSWSSTNATGCTPSGAWAAEGAKPASGSESVSPPQTATYGLSCTGSGGTASATANVEVTQHTIVFTAGPSAFPNPVAAGGTVQLGATAMDSFGHALTYAWTAACTGAGGNGSFDNPASSSPMWTAPPNSSGATVSCVLGVTAADGTGLTQEASVTESVAAGSTGNPGATSFFTLAPCRAIDTRNAAGPFGGPALAAGAARVFTLAGQCGIPSTAKAVSVNVTVVTPTGAGYLVLFPGNVVPANTSTLNFKAGRTLANNAIVQLAGDPAGTMGAMAAMAGGQTVHLLLDVNGYFE